jgi:glycine/D-amino acid oxidase-like deaminating enzyme
MVLTATKKADIMTKTIKLAIRPSGQQFYPTEKPAGLPCPDSSASFWHSQPNKFLLGHRTTDDLPQNADIVIVGSGITGASIARYLTEDSRVSGQSILMIEAREVCWGATGRNGGHCQPLLFDSTPAIAAFEVKNVEAVKSYIEENDIQCAWRSVTGCRTFWSEKSYAVATEAIQNLTKVNPSMGNLVTATNDPAEFEKHRVKPTATGMTLTTGAGQLWPYKYVTFIVEKLVKEGRLNVQTNTPVLSIETGDGVRILTTSRGKVMAKNVILATNGYTSHLLHDFSSLIVPIRCEMSALHPPTTSRLPNSYGMVGYTAGNVEHGDYLIQLPFYEVNGQTHGGQLMFGGGRSNAMYDCIGETDDDTIDPGEADYLRRALPKMLEIGDIAELKASHQWTGIKGNSRDNRPWVGKVPAGDGWYEGLWLCGGYTGHGMPNATLCGKAVVEMMLADDYDAVCNALVEAGDLPHAYVITHTRVDAAHRAPTVMEMEGAI